MPRKTTASGIPACFEHRFNEAAAVMPRKRGNPLLLWDCTDARFNEAAAVMPRKRSPNNSVEKLRIVVMLQ